MGGGISEDDESRSTTGLTTYDDFMHDQYISNGNDYNLGDMNTLDPPSSSYPDDTLKSTTTNSAPTEIFHNIAHSTIYPHHNVKDLTDDSTCSKAVNGKFSQMLCAAPSNDSNHQNDSTCVESINTVLKPIISAAPLNDINPHDNPTCCDTANVMSDPTLSAPNDSKHHNATADFTATNGSEVTSFNGVSTLMCNHTPVQSINPFHTQLPNLAFRLIQITVDMQDLSFVEKVLVSEKDITALCNLIVPSSARTNNRGIVNHLDFSSLDSQRMTVIGFYGDRLVISKVFRKRGLAHPDLLEAMDCNKLSSGLYASFPSAVYGTRSTLYLFYWDARTGEPSAATRKDVSCNFVRYLVDLCEVVYICIDGKNIGGAGHGPTSGHSGLLPLRRQQRIQRLQISVRAELEDDLKLLPGFSVPLPLDYLKTNELRISCGIYRCFVLAGIVNPPKVVSKTCEEWLYPDNTSKFLDSKTSQYTIDCTHLPDDEFELLLKIINKEEELKQLSEQFHQGQQDVSSLLDTFPAVMKRKQKEVLDAWNQVVESYLQYTNPWQESILKSPSEVEEMEEKSDEEQAEITLKLKFDEFESELCELCLGKQPSCQTFLYVGAKVQSTEGGPVYVVFNSPSSLGPICNGQEISLVEASVCIDDTKCELNAIIYQEVGFSNFNQDHTLLMEPIIVEKDSRLVMKVSLQSHHKTMQTKIVCNDSFQGIKQWVDGMCEGNVKSRIIQRNVQAASFLVDKLGTELIKPKIVVGFLQEETLSADMRGLPKEAASVLPTFIEIPNSKTIVHEHVRSVVTDFYKKERKELLLKVQKKVKDQIFKIVEKCARRQHEEEMDLLLNGVFIEKVTILSILKKQLFEDVPTNDQSGLKLCIKGITLNSNVIRKLTYTSKIKLTYTIEENERESVTWKAIELAPEKRNTESSPGGSLVPLFSGSENLCTLNSSSEHLSQVIVMKSGQALVFVEAKDKSWLQIHCYQRIGMLKSGRPLRELKRGFDLVAFDETSRIIAMYSRVQCSIKAYRFDDSFQHMDYTGIDILLSNFSGSSNIVWMEFIPGRRELLLIDDQNRLRVCELANGMMMPQHVTLPSPFLKACTTPDGTCVIVFSNPECNEMQGASIANSGPALSAYVYLLGDSMKFLRCFDLDTIRIENLSYLQADCKYIGGQMHLVFLAFNNLKAYISSHLLDITSAQKTFHLQKVSSEKFPNIVDNNSQSAESATPASLDYIFHIFDKYAISPPLFPDCRILRICVLLDCLNCNEITAKEYSEQHIACSLQKLKNKGKFFENMKLEVVSMVIKDWQDVAIVPNSFTTPPRIKMGEWIQKLLCLVPLQIARAEINVLKPLINGLQIGSDVTYSDAVSLAALLRFGLYDLVISNWKGDVKVISSMGKQSSGKSYLLNHLAGSLLDVAGGRCTDGVWMTVRCTLECLYVLLDYEGLGSFERSEQEDMFLSILNAAISNVTIFNKKDFHLDKETETLFQRFQDGVSIVKKDERLFNGLFYMAIKDVDSADVEDLKLEFFNKINLMCRKSNENFLTTMYGGMVEIAALPPFQKHEFHESLDDIGYTIRDAKSSYQCGRQFLDDMKLVMAQISTRDWAPIDSKRVALRISLLRKNLDSVLRMGQCSDNEPLLDLDEQKDVKDPLISISGSAFDISDAGLQLTAVFDDMEMSSVLTPIREHFESVVPRLQSNDEAWHMLYGKLLEALVDRRKERVMMWVKLNTKDFGDNGDVQKLHLEVAASIADIKSKLMLCSCKCELCFLKCIRIKGHTSEHSCLGNHTCMHQCTFCREQAEEMTLDCKDVAGHAGHHDCKQKMHTCQLSCKFADRSSNCNRKCSLRVDHEGDHRCNSLQHMCRQKCSLPSCRNKCVVPYELGDHSRHACHEKFCPEQCCMAGCNRTCAEQEHFHKVDVAGAVHFCGSEHPCQGECELSGVCEVSTEVVKQIRTFHGKRSEFEYEHVSTQSEVRKTCCLEIPPFQSIHKGPHMHSMNPDVVHFCDSRCPACDYYCQLPIGHAGLHKTVHGNMKNMRFVSEVEEIDVLDRKYARGDSGEAEMCMMHCKARGRGHTHLIPCPTAKTGGCCTEKLYDGARHVASSCSGLGIDIPMDELTHKAYWEYIRFVDPCEEAEKEMFALCGHICQSEEHLQGVSSTKSYCTEYLWHEPIPHAGTLQTGVGGYVTDDGHHFCCSHVRDTPCNVIFVIDKSGSMGSYDISPTMAKFNYSGHQNRLGCVFEAVLRFIKIRLQASNQGQVKDTMSVVLFDYVGLVGAKLEEISESVVDELLVYMASGGTTYSAGLQAVEDILLESNGVQEIETKWPVVIFLSDGGNNGGTDPLYLVQRMRQNEPRLILHTIMFGNDPCEEVLKKMAQVGGGTYQLSLDEVQLARSFESLAKSLRPKLASLVPMPPV